MAFCSKIGNFSHLICVFLFTYNKLLLPVEVKPVIFQKRAVIKNILRAEDIFYYRCIYLVIFVTSGAKDWQSTH